MSKAKKKYAQEIISDLMQLGIELPKEVVQYFATMLAPVQASFEIINQQYALVLTANTVIEDISKVIKIEQERGLSSNTTVFGSIEPGEKHIHFFEKGYGNIKCILKESEVVLAETDIPIPELEATFNKEKGRVEVSLMEGSRLYGEMSFCLTQSGGKNTLSSHSSIYGSDRPASIFPRQIAGQFDLFDHLSGVRLPITIPSPNLTDVRWLNENLVKIQVKSPLDSNYSPNSKIITLKVNDEEKLITWKHMFGEATVEVDSGNVKVALFVKDGDDEREIETKTLPALTKPYMA